MVATSGERLPDEALLAGLGAGDAELALAFVRRFQRIVFGVALAVVGDAGTAVYAGVTGSATLPAHPYTG